VAERAVAELDAWSSDDDRARLLQPLATNIVLLGHVVGIEPRAERLCAALGEHQILDRDGTPASVRRRAAGEGRSSAAAAARACSGAGVERRAGAARPRPSSREAASTVSTGEISRRRTASAMSTAVELGSRDLDAEERSGSDDHIGEVFHGWHEKSG